jgi:phage internal scaffolding protein
MEIRSKYKYQGYSRLKDVKFTMKTMAQQHFRDECNINTIMGRYERTGILVDPLLQRQVKPEFGDFANLPDYQEAQNAIIEAHELFDNLPSSIRKRFDNSPARLLDFMADPDNLDEAIRLGIVSKPLEKPEEPIKAQPLVTDDGQQKSDETKGAAATA